MSDFIHKWEEERENGFGEFYKKKFLGALCLFIGIFIASCIANKGLNIVYLCISLGVSLAFPAIGWGINEVRFIIIKFYK
ncbi:hypothetical protein [Pseudobutyrivibrio sp.]